MRVAICLSGLPRCVQYSISNIEAFLIEPYNADLFVHTWDMLNLDTGRNSDRIVTNEKWNFELLQAFYKQHNAKDIEISSIKQTSHIPVILSKSVSSSLVSMYYSIYRSNELKKKYEEKNGFEYDLVIRCRTDFFYRTPISKEEIDNIRCNLLIYVGVHVYQIRQFFRNLPFVVDNFAFGSSESMDIYSSIFLDISGYSNITNVPESCLAMHLNKHNIMTHTSRIKMMFMREWKKNKLLLCSNYDQYKSETIKTNT